MTRTISMVARIASDRPQVGVRRHRGRRGHLRLPRHCRRHGAGPVLIGGHQMQPDAPPTISVPIKIKRHTVDALRSEARRRGVRADELASAILTNENAAEVSQSNATTLKQRFLAATRGNREPVVLGKGWKYQAIQVSPEESSVRRGERDNMTNFKSGTLQ